MRRLKERWHREYPEKRRTAKNLIENEKSLPKKDGAEFRKTQLGREAQERDTKSKNVERSEEHTSELQSRQYLVCRLLLEKKKKKKTTKNNNNKKKKKTEKKKKKKMSMRAIQAHQ